MVRKIGERRRTGIVAGCGLARAGECGRQHSRPCSQQGREGRGEAFRCRGRGRLFAGRRRSPNRGAGTRCRRRRRRNSRQGPARLSRRAGIHDGCRSRQYPPRRVVACRRRTRVGGGRRGCGVSLFGGNQALSGDELCRPRRRCRYEGSGSLDGGVFGRRRRNLDDVETRMADAVHRYEFGQHGPGVVRCTD